MNDLDEISVTDRLASGGLSPEEALQYATGLAEALRRLHQQGTICASLDPDNILLGRNGLQLARNGAGKELTPYFSPEQLRGEDLDARSNIFAFGAILYELLSGRKAFSAQDPEELKKEILERDPMPLTDISQEVGHILHRCLEKRREDRWQRMSSILVELKLVVNNARHAQQATEWKEKMSTQRAQLAGLEGRLSAHQTAQQETASQLRELIARLEQTNQQQAAEIAKTSQLLATLQDSVAGLQRTTQAQAQAIESIEAASAQTDEVVEHVVDAVGLMHKAMVERVETKVVAASSNGN
jgi:serine/threonine protein kinase